MQQDQDAAHHDPDAHAAQADIPQPDRDAYGCLMPAVHGQALHVTAHSHSNDPEASQSRFARRTSRNAPPDDHVQSAALHVGCLACSGAKQQFACD